MNKILPNPNQLKKYVDTELLIQGHTTLEKLWAISSEENFCDLVYILYLARDMIRTIAGERKKSDYNPVQERKWERENYEEDRRNNL